MLNRFAWYSVGQICGVLGQELSLFCYAYVFVIIMVVVVCLWLSDGASITRIDIALSMWSGHVQIKSEISLIGSVSLHDGGRIQKSRGIIFFFKALCRRESIRYDCMIVPWRRERSEPMVGHKLSLVGSLWRIYGGWTALVVTISRDVK